MSSEYLYTYRPRVIAIVLFSMNLAELLLLLPLLFIIDAAHINSGLRVRKDTYKQTLASFSKTGTCWDYPGPHDRDKALAPCKAWCEKKKRKSSSYAVCRIYFIFVYSHIEDGIKSLMLSFGLPVYRPPH